MGYRYRGVPCLKSPIDIAIFLTAIWDLRPKAVIEIGSHSGGGAWLLADMLDIFGLEAQVYSIDLRPPTGVEHERITFVEGDVSQLERAFDSQDIAGIPHPWFVSEDSAHTYEACLAALTFFSSHMIAGDLLVMEDGVLDDLGLSERYHGGPNRAVEAFLTDNPGAFEIATELCDMFGINATYAPNAYLRKI